MKNILILFFLIFSIYITNAQNYCGYWIAHGYQCAFFDRNGVFYNQPIAYELIYIEQTKDSLIATKIIGDTCVPAGHRTWQAKLTTNNLFDIGIYSRRPGSLFELLKHQIVNVTNTNDSLSIVSLPSYARITYKKLTCQKAQKLGADTTNVRFPCDCNKEVLCKIDLPAGLSVRSFIHQKNAIAGGSF
jgi:hypothetical protein